MNYPAKLEFKYPEKLSRGILLLRAFFGFIYVLIPHGFCLFFLGMAQLFVFFIAFWAILFTGKFPEGMFNFVNGVDRWAYRVNAYFSFLTDKYPAFSMDEKEDDDVRFQVEYPEKLSRGLILLKAFFGFIYVGIPHVFCLYFRGIAACVVMFIAFWAVLFTGKYPEKMFSFVTGTFRWGMRVATYLTFRRDEYPPFSGKEEF